MLMRRLVGRCPHTDMFGQAGRNWLRTLELPLEECESVEAAMRHIEFLDAEIAEIERLIAHDMLRSADANAAERAGRESGLRGNLPRRDRRHPSLPQQPASTPHAKSANE